MHKIHTIPGEIAKLKKEFPENDYIKKLSSLQGMFSNSNQN